MRNPKTISLLWYIASVLCYLTVILNLCLAEHKFSVVWFAFGSAALIFGSIFANKTKKDE